MSPEVAGDCGLRLDGRAVRLGCRLGADTLLVVLDLAVHAVDTPEGPLVAASYRDVARRVGISKDTVGRRMAILRNMGVVMERPESPADRFDVRSYRLRLELAGVSRLAGPAAA